VLRRKAVFLVSRKRNSETEDILLNALRTDPDREVREQAVFWLGQVNSEKSTTALLELLRTSTDNSVLEKAMFSLAQQRSERAQTAIRDMARRSDLSNEIRGNAIFWLGSRGGNADSTTAFLMQLYPTLTEKELKERVLFAVAQRRTPASTRFLTALAMNQSEPMEVRQNALFHASRSGMTLAQLRELYRSSTEKEFKNQVIFAIGNLRTTESVDLLFDIAKNDQDREMRKQAIFWLGISKDPRAPGFLQDILNK
jgi:HEAT repeat protein